MGLRNISKGKCPVIGEYILAEVRAWEGPVYPGQQGREVWTRHLIPREQGRLAMHKRHITTFDPVTGEGFGCIAPSCSFFPELVKRGSLRWRSDEAA